MIDVLKMTKKEEEDIMLVRATDKYEKLKLQDNELGRIPKQGEEFEVSEERYKVLTETNKFNVEFVKLVIKTEDREVAVKVDKETVKEKIKLKKLETKKKTTRKKKE